MTVTHRIKECLRRCFIIALFAILFVAGGTVTRASADSDFVIENRVLVSYTGTAEEVIIPDGVTEIGKKAFSWNSNIKKVVMPDSVTSIGESAFSYCIYLTEVTMSKSLQTIGAYAFYLTNIELLELPDSVTDIGEGAFDSCAELTEIVIPGSVEAVGGYAFARCRKATRIVFEEGVKFIGYQAFYDCSALTEIEIPSSVIYIGYDAFAGCDVLTELRVPAGLKSMAEFTGGFFDSWEFAWPFEGWNGTIYLVKGSALETEMIRRGYSYGTEYFYHSGTEGAVDEPSQDLEEVRDVVLAGILEGQQYEIGNAVTFVVSSETKLTDAYLMFDRPEAWTAENGAVYFTEQTCRDSFSVDLNSYETVDGLYVYYRTVRFNTVGNAADEYRRRVKLAYKYDNSETSYTDEIIFTVYPTASFSASSVSNMANSEYTFKLDSWIEYDGLKIYFDNAQEGGQNSWLSAGFEMSRTIKNDGSYQYIFSKVIDTAGVIKDFGQYCRKFRLMDGETEVMTGKFIVNPAAEPEKPLGEVSISTAWKGTDGRLNNELYCGVGSSVTLQISVTGVAENQSFEVEIYDAYNKLVRKINNSTFFATGSGGEGPVLSCAQKFTFNEAGTHAYMVKLVVGGDTKAASRSAILYVRNEDSLSIEQRNRLEGFKGLCVTDFLTGNSVLAGTDNGLVVNGITYYKYVYYNNGNGYDFFINEADKTLVTDHDVLRKLLYLDTARSFLLANAQHIIGLNSSLPAIIEGVMGHEKGRVASQFTGAIGSAVLSGGSGFASALGTIAWNEVTDIDNYMEIVVLLKFYDYCAFFEELGKAVECELNGVQTDISDYDKVGEYISELFYLSNNYSATFELLRKVAGISDSDNKVVIWCGLFKEYMGAALDTMTFGLSTEAMEYLDYIDESLEEAEGLLNMLDKVSQSYMDNPVRVKNEADVSNMLVESTNTIISEDVVIGTAMEIMDLKDSIENIVMFVQWCAAMRQTEVEMIDCNQDMPAKIDRVIEAYGLVKAASKDFDKPVIKALHELPESLVVGREYVLEFELNGMLTELQASGNVETEWRYGTADSGKTILVKLKIKEDGNQKIKLMFYNEQNGYAEWSTQVLAYGVVESGKNYKISYDVRQNLDDSAEQPDASKTQDSIFQKTEIVEGHGGDDWLEPTYTGKTTYYLYYLDEGDGHDTIVDIGGGDYVCLIGENASILNVTVKQQEKGWDISYNGETVVSFQHYGVTTKPIYVIVAKNAVFSESIFGDSCTLTEASKLELKTPKYLAEAKCPVDVLVIDGDGEVVQTLRDGQESTDFTEYGMFIVSYNEAGGGYLKQVYLYDDNYTVKIVGNGEGTMKYRFARANADGSIETYYREGIEITEDVVIDVDLATPASLTDSQGNVIAVEQKEVLQCLFEEPEKVTAVADVDEEEPGQDEPSDTEPSEDIPAVSENPGVPGYVWIIAIGAAAVVAMAVVVLVIKNKKKEV